jgi:hypothetical protein
MKFFPVWEDAASLRSFLTYLIGKNIHHKQILEKIGIGISELINNTCKHSAINGIIFEIKENTDQSSLTINIKNITTKEKIHEFKKILTMIKKGNPKEIYKKMMYRSVEMMNNSKEMTNISQLGLARIRYECSTRISYKILKGIKKYFNEIEYIAEKENELLILSIDLEILLNNNSKNDIYNDND